MGGKETRHDIDPPHPDGRGIDLLDQTCKSNPRLRLMTHAERMERGQIGSTLWRLDDVGAFYSPGVMGVGV